MSQTLQNQITYAKSMNGIVTLSDGAGSTISNGIIVTNDLSGNSIVTNSFNTDDIILTRNSTPAVNALLGSTIDVGAILNNVNFDTAQRFISFFADTADGMMDIDLSGNGIGMAPNNLSIFPTNALNFACPNITFTNSVVSFPTSTVSFNSNLPTSTLTPTTGNQLITKTYADTTYAVAGAYATLGGNNAFTGTNTFNTNLPTSTLAATSNNEFITKLFGDFNYARLGLGLTNNFISTNTFNTSLPTSTVASSTTGTQFITRNIADGRFGQLAAANAWTSTNTFDTNLPTSTVASSSSGTQFITRNIGDGRFGRLATANTWTLQNTFQNGILPCSGTRTTDIQMGGNNQFQYRQATSANNISIGDQTLQGDSTVGWTQYNTGSRNIGIGGQVLTRLDIGSDNIFMGYQAGKNCGSARIHGVGVTPQRCIAIGTFSQLGNLYATDAISIGYNSLINASGPAIGNICIGSNVGNGLTFQSNNVLIGTSCGPSVNDNSVTGIGFQALGAATGQFNSGTAIGTQAGYNNANGQGGTFVGAEAGFTNTTGNNNTCIGLKAGRNNASGALNLTCCIGFNSAAQQDNECVFGGELSTEQVFLTLPNKVRLACNQSPTGVAIGLSFRTNENVMITDATTTSINLPTPATTGVNVGTRFHIIRVVATSNITVNAPAGQTIGLYQPNGAYITNTSFVWTYASGSIDVLCIGSTAGGTNWILLPPSISEGTNSLLSSTTIPSPSLNYSISFGGQTTTGYHPYFMDNTNMNYQPSTQILTTTNQTITGSVVYKKYNLSMVNPTILTGSTPLIMAPPLYEYTRLNLASGVVQLPLSSDVEIGTVLRFRRITTMTGAINLEIQTGSGQSILGRNSITTAINVPFLAANVTYGSVVFLSSNIWAVND